MHPYLEEDQIPGIGHNYGRNSPPSLADIPPDSQHILACPRVPVGKIMHLLKNKMQWLDQIREKAVRECCKHPENHDIEAWYSMQSEKDKGVPDVYKFYCKTCEENGDPACHVKFCVGGNHPLAKRFSKQERPELFDSRPFWERR
jgi:hypothetical protein